MSAGPSIFKSLLNEEVYRSGQVMQFPSGSVILNINAYVRSIPIVLSGSLKVMKTDEDGQEILLYYIKPGESCIMSLLAGLHQDTSKIKAIVEEDVELLLIPVEKAGVWIRQFPEWTDFIFTLYQKRFEELLDVVNALAFQKLDSRLLQLLHQKADLFHTKALSVTHQQLADELGSTREAISRLLKQLENNQQISISRHKITLM